MHVMEGLYTHKGTNHGLGELQKWYQRNSAQVLRDFFTFLRFPSISTDPKYNGESRRTAEWLREYLQGMGLETVLWESPGLPVVFGSLCRAGPDRPTLLVYHHYDVQPVDPLELWHSDPFEPVVRNGQVFARGAVDNKGQCFYSLTALKAFLELFPQCDFNIKVFIEGEEESGSRGTAAVIAQKKEELKADYLLVVDLGLPAPGVPSVTLGMRGILSMQVECANSRADLHSGEHGGIALNPNRALACLLAQLWDSSGRVAVPGFYDAVCTPSQKELVAFDWSFDQQEYEKTFGVKAFGAEEGYGLKESNWLRPTVEINGMWGGYTGPGVKTVIPAKAGAKISCRLVPDQRPDEVGELIAQFLQSRVAQGIDLKVELHHGAPAYRALPDSPIVKIAACAYEEVFKRPCQFLLCGASVPIVVDLAAASGAEVAGIGVGLSDDEIHSPNEHFGLDRFEQGFLCMERIFQQLSK
jgi:acetylornithine deacetylase/succinyl-diaminopimelate desuccinylase-like protein